MKVPNKCPAHRDPLSAIINYIQLGLSCIIVFFIHWSLSLIYIVYWIFFIFIFLDKYVCKNCIYKIGSKVDSIEEYSNKYGKIFLNCFKKMIPLMILQWFFPIISGLIYSILDHNTINLLIIIPLIGTQIFLLIFFMIRAKKKHCPNCLLRNICLMGS
ncbi:MAG: hypothetical protein JXA99_08235 [Candidatus Lokiarchaeota archaeon]|nr:hypothetical protein [Candidatus Lokiarchaeota archaeon]